MGKFQGVYDSSGDHSRPTAGSDRPQVAVRNVSSATPVSQEQMSESQLGRRESDLDRTESGEIICNFLLKNIRQRSPEWILETFLKLLYYRQDTGDKQVNSACWQLVDRNQKQQFLYVLKRSFYILIHNWSATRNSQAIQKLLAVFSELVEIEERKKPQSLLSRRLTQWLLEFLHGEDYQQIQHFASGDRPKEHRIAAEQPQTKWRDRPRSSLLMSQCIIRSPQSQALDEQGCKPVKEQFKFDLAMYAVRPRSSSPTAPQPKNPTTLGDRIWPLIHKVLEKRGIFNCKNLANIFLKQTEGIRYSHFKQSLLKYLMFSVEEELLGKLLSRSIEKELFALYEEYDETITDSRLLLRTCNRIIDFFTSTDNQSPSSLFTQFVERDRGTFLAIILLKVILISQESHRHLEACIAVLIQYYERQEVDYLRPLQFLEALGVTFTICVENVCYDLVNMADYPQQQFLQKSQSYRVFSQVQL